MKNLIKFFMVLAVLFVVAACSQTTEGNQEATKGRLVMNIAGESRTIMPTVTEADIKSAVLKANDVDVKNWDGNDIIEQIENDNSIQLDVGSYNFEMIFKNQNGDMLFCGNINGKNIEVGDNSLVFDMKKCVTGNGNIDIELYWDTNKYKITGIKVGLCDIATGKAIENYEMKRIMINAGMTKYTENNVPAGQYVIKFEIYSGNNGELLLNTLIDVIKIVGGKNTVEKRTLSMINAPLYTITYDLAGGSWNEGFTPVTMHEVNKGVVLPTFENIKNESENVILAGWYDEVGNLIKEIPSGTEKNITLTAKWWDSTDFVYVQGATITGAITGSGYTTSSIFKAGNPVTVSNFYMCDHEVTQAEYKKYCSYTDSERTPNSTYGYGNNYPAYYVSWYDALVYCNIRSIKEGLTPYYTIKDSTKPDDWGTVPTSNDSTWNAVTCDFTANGYRLPTELEWEYAARGGNGLTATQYEYAGSDIISDVAWYKNNSGSQTHTVKGRAANGLGLYDMTGNVDEWCWDSSDFGDRYKRGGSWNGSAGSCTVSYRSHDDACSRYGGVGFRVVRTAE